MTSSRIRRRVVFSVAAITTVGCQLAPKPPANNQESLGFLQRTQANVEEALRIEPRVDRAADQTRLDYDAGPIKPELHLSAAAVMEQSGNLEGATKHYQQVLGMDPSNRTAIIGVARLHHRAGEIDKAIAAYRRATRVLGNDPVILNDLALCYTRTNRHVEAAEALRAALALKPDSLLYRNNLAAVLVQSNRADEAVRVLSETHGMAVAHYNVGYLLNQHGEPAAASAHFVQSLRANPSFQPARTMLERVLPEVGRGSEERIAEGPPSSASAAVNHFPSGTSGGLAPTQGQVHENQPGGLVRASLSTDAATPERVSPPELANLVQPSVDQASIRPTFDLVQRPTIRLPDPIAPRRTSEGIGGYVAPAPTLE